VKLLFIQHKIFHLKIKIAYLLFQVNDETITIGGKEYPKSGHTFILTGKNWNGFKNMLAIISNDLESLPRIGQLVPHYGKYSFLVFKGAKNVGKGQWAVKDSPLKKVF